MNYFVVERTMYSDSSLDSQTAAAEATAPVAATATAPVATASIATATVAAWVERVDRRVTASFELFMSEFSQNSMSEP